MRGDCGVRFRVLGVGLEAQTLSFPLVICSVCDICHSDADNEADKFLRYAPETREQL